MKRFLLCLVGLFMMWNGLSTTTAYADYWGYNGVSGATAPWANYAYPLTNNFPNGNATRQLLARPVYMYQVWGSYKVAANEHVDKTTCTTHTCCQNTIDQNKYFDGWVEDWGGGNYHCYGWYYKQEEGWGYNNVMGAISGWEYSYPSGANVIETGTYHSYQDYYDTTNPTLGSCTLQNATATTVELKCASASDNYSGVEGVYFTAWKTGASEPGASSGTKGTKQSDGSWVYKFSISDLTTQAGTYHIKAYAKDVAGNWSTGSSSSHSFGGFTLGISTTIAKPDNGLPLSGITIFNDNGVAKLHYLGWHRLVGVSSIDRNYYYMNVKKSEGTIVDTIYDYKGTNQDFEGTFDLNKFANGNYYLEHCMQTSGVSHCQALYKPDVDTGWVTIGNNQNKKVARLYTASNGVLMFQVADGTASVNTYGVTSSNGSTYLQVGATFANVNNAQVGSNLSQQRLNLHQQSTGTIVNSFTTFSLINGWHTRFEMWDGTLNSLSPGTYYFSVDIGLLSQTGGTVSTYQERLPYGSASSYPAKLQLADKEITFSQDASGNLLMTVSQGDKVKPTIGSCQIENLTYSQYDVVCSGVQDNYSGITGVYFPTWVHEQTSAGAWTTGTKVSEGVYRYTVKRSDHENRSGTFLTHVYAQDGYGNLSDPYGISQPLGDFYMELSSSISKPENGLAEAGVTLFNDNGVSKLHYLGRHLFDGLEGVDSAQFFANLRQNDGTFVKRIFDYTGSEYYFESTVELNGLNEGIYYLEHCMVRANHTNCQAFRKNGVDTGWVTIGNNQNNKIARLYTNANGVLVFQIASANMILENHGVTVSEDEVHVKLGGTLGENYTVNQAKVGTTLVNETLNIHQLNGGTVIATSTSFTRTNTWYTQFGLSKSLLNQLSDGDYYFSMDVGVISQTGATASLNSKTVSYDLSTGSYPSSLTLSNRTLSFSRHSDGRLIMTVTTMKQSSVFIEISQKNWTTHSFPVIFTGVVETGGTLQYRLLGAQTLDWTTTTPGSSIIVSGEGITIVEARIQTASGTVAVSKRGVGRRDSSQPDILINEVIHQSYASGSGTVDDPYLITTPEELDYLRYQVNVEKVETSGKYYALGNDINLAGFDTDNDDSNGNFEPIGTENNPFNGHFDGNLFAIHHLNINLPSNDNVGLFGVVDMYADVSNLLLRNIAITGYDNVGGVVGKHIRSSSSMSYVSAEGTVTGHDNVGGLAGKFNDVLYLTNTSMEGTVVGNDNVGGLAGSTGDAYFAYSYVQGEVRGTQNIGGLVGKVQNKDVFMFIFNYVAAEIEFVKQGDVFGENFGGESSDFAMYNIWNSQLNPVFPKTPYSYSTAEMQGIESTKSMFLFVGLPEVILCNNDYPVFEWERKGCSLPAAYEGRGTANSPYVIKTPLELHYLGVQVQIQNWDTTNQYYVLGNDLDFDGFEVLFGEDSFTNYPIGTTEYPFAGNFDGQGFEIANLSGSDVLGLGNSIFGITNGATISNLSVRNFSFKGSTISDTGALASQAIDSHIFNIEVQGEISGTNNIGGLIGISRSSQISNISSNVNIAGKSNVAGIIGLMEGGSLTNSYGIGETFGENNVGGVIGQLSDGTTSTLSQTFIAGKITGSNQVGNLIGNIEGKHIFQDNYWDKLITTQPDNRIGVGLLTAEMQDFQAKLRLIGFDFETIWRTCEDAYPELQWQASACGSPNGYDSGDGTQDNPYLIRTPEQLDYLRYQVNVEKIDTSGVYYALGNDIDLSGFDSDSIPSNGNFEPIGYMENTSNYNYFKGTFDGRGFKVQGFSYLDAEKGYYVGLFGRVMNATIQNLTLTNVHIEANRYAGGIVAHAENSTLSHLSVTGQLIVGRGQSDVLAGRMVGGIVGGVNNSTLTHLEADIVIEGKEGVGGLVGDMTVNSHLSYGISRGEVQGVSQTGGLVGRLLSNAIIDHSNSSAVITASQQVGGLIGEMNTSVLQMSFSTGDVKATDGSDAKAGGLVGLATKATINDSYALSRVEGAGRYVGGVVGLHEESKTTNVYSTGMIISSATESGALMGAHQITSTLTSGYWSTTVKAIGIGIESNSATTISGLSDRDLSGMPSKLAFVGFDFNTMWRACEDRTPQLQWEAPACVSASEGFASGDGSEINPFLITTPEELNYLRYLVNEAKIETLGVHYALGNDIDLTSYDSDSVSSNGNFGPIGYWLSVDDHRAFQGYFDGRGYQISGLTIQISGQSHVGLFGEIDQATIQNLTLTNFEILGDENVGGVAGYATQSTLQNIQLRNALVVGKRNVGGIVGDGSGLTLKNIDVMETEVRGTYENIGGVSGHLEDSQLTHAWIQGSKKVTSQGDNVGGIVGSSSATTYHQLGSDINIEGRSSVGGLIGYAHSGSVITQSFSTGILTGIDWNAGGLIGSLEDGGIQDSYSWMTINGNEDVAGLVGKQVGATLIERVYGATTLTGSDSPTVQIGGLVGRYESDLTLTAGYWDDQTAPSVTVSLGTSLHVSEMKGTKAKTNFEGFDFDAVWRVCSNGYAELRWQTTSCGQPTPEPGDPGGGGGTNPTGPYGGGSGTADDPYHIYTYEHLNELRLQVISDTSTKGQYFKIMNDIDFNGKDTDSNPDNGNWSPIGLFINYNNYKSFEGALDGQGYALMNMTINASSQNQQGLFGYFSGGTVTNLNLQNVNLIGNEKIGGLIGEGRKGTIENVTVSGSIQGTNSLGGVAGYLQDIAVTGAHSDAIIKGNLDVGGLIGTHRWAPLERSSFTGSVEGKYYVGGLVGNLVKATIENSYSITTVKGSTHVGGLVGLADINSAVQHSYSASTVEGTTQIGSLVGMLTDSTLLESYWSRALSTLNAVGLSEGTSTVTSASGYSASQMTGTRAKTFMKFLDFETIWDISDTYPVLRGQATPRLIEQLLLLTTLSLENEAMEEENQLLEENQQSEGEVDTPTDEGIEEEVVIVPPTLPDLEETPEQEGEISDPAEPHLPPTTEDDLGVEEVSPLPPLLLPDEPTLEPTEEEKDEIQAPAEDITEKVLEKSVTS